VGPEEGAVRAFRWLQVRLAFLLVAVGCALPQAVLKADEPSAQTEGSSSKRWEELSATELTEALRQKSLVYVPIGTLEFHGPHLPLGMDAIHAHEFCLAAAEQTGGVVLPAMYWSPHGHEGWPGSTLVREETFRALLTDVFTLVAKHDVKLIVASTGHYPSKQEPAIRKIAEGIMKQFPQTRILVLGPWCHPTDPSADHGGKKETSLMLALRPSLVHMERLGGEQTMRGIAPSAVDGTSEFGKAYFDAALENFVARVNEGKP
jgi:creatinine amidohydrolase